MGKREQELAKNVAKQFKESIDKAIDKKIQEKRYTYTMTTPYDIWRDDNWDMWRNYYGHYNGRCSFIKTNTKLKGDNNMKLRIKKTDKLTVEELQECEKAYDCIIQKINEEKFNTFKEDYGTSLFQCNSSYVVEIDGFIIEFMPKAINESNTFYSCKH